MLFKFSVMKRSQVFRNYNQVDVSLQNCWSLLDQEGEAEKRVNHETGAVSRMHS
jgi:hypothetical protein